MISAKEILEIADKPSHLRSKAEAMGFRFSPARITPSWIADGCLNLTMGFQCVCGRDETVNIVLSPPMLEYSPRSLLEVDADLVAYLWRAGSFSREHLTEDGYSEAQIADILARGEAYDQRAQREFQA